MNPSSCPRQPAVSKWYEQNPLCVTEWAQDISQCPIPSSSDNKLALTPFGKHWAFQGHLSPQDLADLTSQITGPVTAPCIGGCVLVLHSHSHSLPFRGVSQLSSAAGCFQGRTERVDLQDGHRGRGPGRELFSGQGSGLCPVGKEELI